MVWRVPMIMRRDGDGDGDEDEDGAQPMKMIMIMIMTQLLLLMGSADSVVVVGGGGGACNNNAGQEEGGGDPQQPLHGRTHPATSVGESETQKHAVTQDPTKQHPQAPLAPATPLGPHAHTTAPGETTTTSLSHHLPTWNSHVYFSGCPSSMPP